MPALFRHLDDLPRQFRGGVVSIGNFDGVHAGHARIVRRLVDMARPMERPGRHLDLRSASGKDIASP